ncbi:hypothetical protein SUGI_0657570 [Cryptomeria japonica]|nr:hypothetical protein SUGI_0657570 [Cryptomeria japonica]
MVVGFVFFCLVVLYIFAKHVGILKLQCKLSASTKSDHTETYLAINYPHHASSSYFVKEKVKATIGISEKTVAMDASPSSEPALLDNSINQISNSNPVDSNVQLNINDGKETRIHLISSNPSFLSKNFLPQSHDEL